jgi:lysophospholipase L1-like esterase
MNCYTSKIDSPDKSLLALAFGNKMINLNIIGDSISQRSNAFSLSSRLGSPYIVNDYSVSGRTLEGWLSDISTLFQVQPDIIIIELGTNDAMSDAYTRYGMNLSTLISEIRKRSQARIIMTALPLTKNNDVRIKIKSLNQIVRSYSSQFSIAEMELPFEQNQNYLNLYSDIDPIHPNESGYNVLGEIYRKTILGL